MTQEEKRIKLVDTVTNDPTQMSVGKATEIFLISLKGFFDETTGGKRIKKNIGEDDFAILFTGLSTTFMSSIFVSAANNKDDLKKRVEFVTDAVHDILASTKIKGVDA